MPPLPAVGSRWGENGSECTTPGGHASGGHNELWTFGDATTPMLIKMVELRESLKEYVMELVRARSKPVAGAAVCVLICPIAPTFENGPCTALYATGTEHNFIWYPSDATVVLCLS